VWICNPNEPWKGEWFVPPLLTADEEFREKYIVPALAMNPKTDWYNSSEVEITPMGEWRSTEALAYQDWKRTLSGVDNG
jgi:hypothetical protein